MVVEEIFVPLSFGEFGNDDDDAAIGPFGGEPKYVLDDRNDHKAIRRRKANEFRRRITGSLERFDNQTIPLFVENLGMFVGLDVDGDDIGGKARGEFEAVARDVAVVIDGNDSDGFGRVTRGNHGHGAPRDRRDRVIVAADR